jgi:hypothetical protein
MILFWMLEIGAFLYLDSLVLFGVSVGLVLKSLPIWGTVMILSVALFLYLTVDVEDKIDEILR